MSAVIILPARYRHVGIEQVRSTDLAATDIYDGTELVGTIVERANGQHEATPPMGASLGLYTSPTAAARALLARRRT